MRKSALLAITAMVAAGFAIAGAAAPPTQSVELPTSPLERLIATGELPADVRGDPGVWNFAGPASACPGPGWTCETVGATPVVQNGTVNVAVAADCQEVEQNGVVNQMTCTHEEKKSPTKVQTCGTATAPITQNGVHNELICKLIYDVTSTEPTQCVLQEGHFIQSGPAAVTTDPSETNKFKGQFRIVQQLMVKSATGEQTQDARQLIDGEQRATAWNESEIQEVEIQKLAGSATKQDQNTGCPAPVPDVPSLAELQDCNPVSALPSKPYICVNLEQTVSGGGDNISKLKQELRQDAQTSSPTATETQGTATGGNDARVHQVINGSGSTNLGLADQYTYQTLPVRSVLVQSQFEDPFCCGTQEGGDEDSEEQANQWVQQQAGDDALQEAHATGVSASDGECGVTHNLENNGGTVQTSQAEDPPCDITGTSSCTGGVEGSCISTNCPPGEFFNSESGRCEEEPTETLTMPRPAAWSAGANQA